MLPAPLETFRHVFYDCPAVNKVIKEFFVKYFNIPIVSCEIFFSGALTEHESKNKVFQLCMDILRYNIWLYKLEKKIPSAHLIVKEVNRTFECIFKISNKTLTQFRKCLFLLGNEDEQDNNHGE